jgi:hypothetical protein
MRARSLVGAALIGAFLVGALGVAHADEKKKAPKADATLKISAKALAAGAGYSWGGGKLTYKGKEYDITIDGLTVGAVGITSISASGKVYDLKKLEDFDGNYTAVVAGSAIGGGGGVLTMRNQNDVEVTLKATTRGVSLTIGVSGVKLAIKK